MTGLNHKTGVLGGLVSASLLLFANLAGSIQAQSPLPMADQTAIFQATLAKLFGEATAFTAQAEMAAADQAKTEILRMTLDFALLDGKMWMDLDLGRIKSDKIPPGAIASLQKMGMDRMLNVVRPDKQVTLLIYPRLASYVEAPLTKEDASAYSKTTKIDKTAIGKETIDGHPCVKSKIIVAEENGKKHEGIVWTANDLKNFPVRMDFMEPDTTISMRFKNIQFVRPDSSRFDPPADFKKHSDVQQLMQSVMEKMTRAPEGAAPTAPPPAR
jgi:hypothetical protein